ncbi:50S ribosomal protein L15 [candidate division KSB1 bacterium]|nr:50S ribosomal protein L15 [candidate division KSB1 bacterium]
MSLSNLKPAAGSTHKKKRIGRGPSSGSGGSAGRGEKGYLARAGSVRKKGFEGGQMPIYRRLPKFGFKNLWADPVQIVNIRDLDKLTGTTVDAASLKQAGLIRYVEQAVKILGNGDAKRPYEVKGCKLSASAAAKITGAGGRVDTD